MSASFFKKFHYKKDKSAYFAFSIFLFIFILTFASFHAPTGYSIADTSYSINAIALEDGADADVVIAASDFASKHYITETMLTSELSGTEQNTLLVKNFAALKTTITQSESNLILEGNAIEGFAALSLLDSTNYDLFSTHDVVEVVNGNIVGITDSSLDQTTQVITPESNVNNYCYDSDGGDDPYVYGTLSGTDVYGNLIDQTDQCGSGTATMNDVFEKVCTEESYTYTQHTCEYGCIDGACLSRVSEPIVEIEKGCLETSTGVAGTYTGYYYDLYGTDQKDYSYDYTYTNYCYYDSYSGIYYYNDYYCYQYDYDKKWYATSTYTQCSSGCDNEKGCIDVATVTPSCTDTDNGKDEKTYGETTVVNKFGEQRIAADTCYSWTDDYHYVVENYCYQWDNTHYLYTDYILCDGVCKDGACVEAAYSATCVDSDETEVYEYDWQKSASTYGTVTGIDKSGNDIEKSDYCYDSYGYGYVVEQYCNEKNARYETYVFCPGGCKDGVCVKPTWEQSCKDSDATATNAGRDIYTYGTASGIDYYGTAFSYNDYCYYSNWDNTDYLVDYYCAESSYSGVYASSYWDSCPEGCENGACISAAAKVTPTCSAADNSVSGIDMYGTSYTYYDYCNGAETLVSYSCGTDGLAVAEETSCNCVDKQCHTATITVAAFIQTMDPIIVIGSSAATEDNIAAIDLAGAYGWKVVTDATISDPTTGIYVSIGGPYANKVSEAAFGGQTWDYGVGEALFLVKEHDSKGKTLVISGSEAQDTRNAVKLLINNPDILTDIYVVERVS